MSLENAKKLVSELNADSALREKFRKNPEAALAEKDYGCTSDELKEALVFSRELDAKELDTVTGGRALDDGIPGGGIKGPKVGSCTGTYFAEKCTATVEDRSVCWTDDWCLIWDSVYTTIYEPRNK